MAAPIERIKNLIIPPKKPLTEAQLMEQAKKTYARETKRIQKGKNTNVL